MDKTQKILTTLLWGVLVVAMVAVVGTGLWARWRHDPAATADAAAAMPVLYDAPAFALIDQEGRPVSSEQLRGRPYVATFIITHCAGVCPMMTQKMATLQKAVPADADVKLLSFTVDPERDTPAVLNEYAKRFNADPARWHFVTGSKAQLDDVARGMKVAVQKATDGSDQFIHTEKFLLIDGGGHVRGIYSSNDDQSLKQLATDAAALSRAGAAVARKG